MEDVKQLVELANKADEFESLNRDLGDLVHKLTRIVQEYEQLSKTELSVDEIKTIKIAKSILGYACPVSIEEGTGVLVHKIEV